MVSQNIQNSSTSSLLRTAGAWKRPSRLLSFGLTCACLTLWGLFSVLGVLMASGCSQFPNLLASSSHRTTTKEQELKYRERYQNTHSADALLWLVSNRLKNGMSKAEVDEIIGEEGEREFNETPILKGGPYRTDDLVYRWGPDREGNVYMLIFRDDHLVNFEHLAKELETYSSPRIGLSFSSDDF